MCHAHRDLCRRHRRSRLRRGPGPGDRAARAGLDDGTRCKKTAAILAKRFRVIRLHCRQYRLDLKADPKLGGSPCSVAQAQIDSIEAMDRLGVRLDTYARINVPTVLLSGDRSPAHLSERLDAIERVMPPAERIVMRKRDHGADLKHPKEVACVIETLADKVLQHR